MAIEDIHHALAAAAQARSGRPATPADIAALLAGKPAVEATAAIEPQPESQPETPRRRGRPPRVRTEEPPS